MKKFSFATLLALCSALLVVTVVLAAISNGDFETGDFTGWAKSAFINNGFSTAPGSGGTDLSVIVGTSGSGPLSFSDAHTSGNLLYPAYGDFSARVNSDASYTAGGFARNANTITQTVSAVLDPNDNLAHVRFTYSAVMVDPVSSPHTAEQKPYFRVRVINTSNSNDVIFDFSSYVNEPGKNWLNGPTFSGSDSWKYIDWQYVDLASSVAHPVNNGDNITIEFTAAGCSLGGHPGYVYVDEITDGDIAGPNIQASGPATRITGQTITYTYNYHNGSGSSINPTITVNQPTGVTFTSVSDLVNCSLAAGTVTCNYTGVTAGADGSFTINGTVTAPGGSQIAHGEYSIAASGFPTVGGPTVLTDVTAIDVTINQAAGQSDPTSTSPVLFTAVFSSAVTGFTGSDVNLGASTVGGTLSASVTEVAPMDGTTYRVSVTGMTTSGNVVASIGSNVTNEGNNASTSTDNVVTFNNAITISGNAAGVGGVTLTYNDGGIKTVTSNADGTYTITVTSGWSGTVTPSKPNYADFYIPASRTYTNVTANQTRQNYGAQVTFRPSNPNLDGWIVESAINSGIGGTAYGRSTTFRVGDDASNRRYMGILNFYTAKLPDVPVNIIFMGLRLKMNAVTGTNPFTYPNTATLSIAIKKGTFGNPGIAPSDFQSPASASRAGFFNKNPILNWYKGNFYLPGKQNINTAGNTQFRLTFTLNMKNSTADYVTFYSGLASPDDRPLLTIKYLMP